MIFPKVCRLVIAAVVLFAGIASGETAVTAAMLNGLEWRSVGPAVMGGRISDIEGVPGNPAVLLAAAGSGGLFRTQDSGQTWASLFDRQTTISIGAIAVQPSSKVIWVGTGESNVRNSVSFGDGLYKSEDGGATWKKTGLENTKTISRIVINPRNPDNVFVAAVGHPFGPNPDRGVFVTNDGGHTWHKTLYIDENHGASDLEINPANPAILYAGMWHFDRKPWTYISGSEGGGVFQSNDGGVTWKKLTEGLPKLMGRIGVKVAPSNPNIVYVIAESKDGTLYRSDDGGRTFTRISTERELVGRGYYFSDLRVSPENENHIFVLADALLESTDAGRHFHRIGASVHGDLHALWIDPENPQRIWQGNDGGLAVTYDAGQHWEQINNIPLGQFYQVSADNRGLFYHLTAGMQDNGTWTGPSRTREPAGIFNDDWRMVNPMVGFHSLSDPDNPDLILTEQPGGALLLNNLQTREQQVVSPQPQNLSGTPAKDMKYRFNWDAPLIRSPFGKSTIYLAGNVVFQSSDYGKSWETISNDLTKTEAARLGNVGGPIWIDNSASEVYSTITALAESPIKRGVLWAGTDDGNLQLTINGGGKWTNVAAKLPGVPPDSPVSHIEPSIANENTAYVALDRHMFDDFHPYVFKTMDAGKSWTSISTNLPSQAFLWTIREDPHRPGLLYAGTELGLYALWPNSTEWVPLHLKNMPWSVSVRDIIFQPSYNDIILATHGRSLWVLDDATVLQQLPDATQKPATLFPIRSAMRFTQRATRYGFGDKTFTGPNPPYGALITYYLGSETKDAKIQILDQSGAVVRTITAPGRAGLNRATWDLRYSPPQSRQRAARGPQALPGRYTARLIINGQSLEQILLVELDPDLKVSPEDLKTQFEITSGIVKMQSSLAASITKLNSLREKDPQQTQALSRLLARPESAGRSEAPSGLRENLDTLFTMIDSVNAAPTAAQTRYFEQLRSQYQDITSKLDALSGTANQ